MKSFFTVIYALACVIFLAFGLYQWTTNTTVHIEASNQTTIEEPVDPKLAKIEQLLPLTKNWPQQSVERFKQALETDTTFNIVIVGSTALGGESGWAVQTKTKLLESYGTEHMNVEILEYDLTTADFIDDKLVELAALKGDLVLLEPFILNDNAGLIKIDDTLTNLTLIIDTVKQANSETVFLLQPAHPIFQAKRYPVQISELKQYATKNNIPFLDHWSSWPDSNTEEIKEYLVKDQSQPNEMGHQLWSEFITNQLISK